MGVTIESAIHELNNWLGFWHLYVKQWGRFLPHVIFHPLFLKISFHLCLSSCLSCHAYVVHFTCLQKFRMEEIVNIPTCNFFEMVHNVWLQGPSMVGVPHLNPKNSLQGLPNSPFSSLFPWHVLFFTFFLHVKWNNFVPNFI